jgi:transaldolase/glucose-6-phosphate isomerase
MAKPKDLIEYGQSYWLDNLTRDMLDSGELEENIRSRGLRGMTSNPKIFHDAIVGGSAYDAQIRELVSQRLPVEKIYEALAIADVRRACDLFRSVFEESGGKDGFVSLEVSPYLAHDTAATMEEARRLFSDVDRPNVMIKIPGTAAGLDAIEEMLFEGVNVNITLLFSIERYRAVAERYLRALERRLRDGRPIDRIGSVASFFLSRIDVLADRLLGQRIVPGAANGRPPETLFGELAIASAKLAYRSFQEIFSGDRFARLSSRGASVQRLLWASTSTKNPCYSDVKYVEPLIGPQTVNTMPSKTIRAFADHGVLRENSLEENAAAAELVTKELAAVGIDIQGVTWQLENEGVQKFIEPFDELMGALAQKRQEQLSLRHQDLGSRRPAALESMLRALQELQLGRRLHGGDPWLWTRDPKEAVRISERLGWRTSVEEFRQRAAELVQFAGNCRAAYDRVLLMGMGGSSLAASVCSEIFGSRPGYPELRVLDSTNPTEVKRAERWITAGRTMFVVASKSGTTSETMSFYHYFYERVRRARGEEAARHFVVITDPATPLAEEAGSRGFRRFENPRDIGGRYSALSYFGLVPMALIGMDIDELLNRAYQMVRSSDPATPVEASPALDLGAALRTARA